MKNLNLKIIAVCIIVFCNIQIGKAQQEVDFTYDAAGNQTKREFICVNCIIPSSPPVFASAPVKLMSESDKSSKEKKRTLIAFPNPVSEILTLKWDSYEYYIQSVAVSSVSGASVYKQTYPYVEGQLQITIPFSNLAAGLYVINVIYSDAKQDVVRVIKINR